MKKLGFVRYDLDKVYFLNEYNKTVSYGNQNINISGVREKLQELERERQIYTQKVESTINPERENEQLKYQQYQKWIERKQKSKWIEIGLILFFIVRLNFFKYLPVGLRTSLLFSLFDLFVTLLVLFIGPLSFIISKIIAHSYAIGYRKYIEPIAATIDNLGSSFQRISLDYYHAIDNLYLLSLDSVHRELILLRRQQEEQNQNMLRLEKERKEAEEKHLHEQRMTRQATEKLLAIEKERENRYKKYRRW